MFDAYFVNIYTGSEYLVSGRIVVRLGSLYIDDGTKAYPLVRPYIDCEVFRDGERQSCYRSENGKVVFVDYADWF